MMVPFAQKPHKLRLRGAIVVMQLYSHPICAANCLNVNRAVVTHCPIGAKWLPQRKGPRSEVRWHAKASRLALSHRYGVEPQNMQRLKSSATLRYARGHKYREFEVHSNPLQGGRLIALSKLMQMYPFIGLASFVLTAACGPATEAKTVTTTDTSRTSPDGQSQQTTTSDTQVVQTDGSKQTKHTEEVKTQPAPKK
jgi:hypothetical protein